VKIFFSEAKIGSIIKELFSWDEPTCTISRLFCMGNYNYRGNWHRDDDINQIFNYGSFFEKINTIQVGIYFENQFGFRILKKDYEYGQKKELIDINIENLNSKNQFPLQPHISSYSNVGGSAGSILIFDFHMRFQKKYDGLKKENNFQDFSVIEKLHEEFDLKSSDIDFPIINRQKITLRLLNSINYLIPIYNLYKISKRKDINKKLSKFGRPDIFSNTLYQKGN